MANTLLKPIYLCLFILLISTFPLRALSHSAMEHSDESDECSAESGDCINKSKAQTLKVIAIFAILVTSMIGIGSPLLTTSIPFLRPENNIFIMVKAFASGIILATSFMHVLPDSFDMLGSECLSEKPWRKFPFSGFVAMMSAVFTLMVDSLTTSFYTNKNKNEVLPEMQMAVRNDQEAVMGVGHYHGHGHSHTHGLSLATKEGVEGKQLLRFKVIAMVLEMGIIVHSVVIGLGMGASNNTCSLKPLIAAMCFHQMFEGMGLGGCIIQAEYGKLKNLAMAFFFAVTTPFGIAVGLALQSSYRENSPTALIIVGLLNASSAGLLIYMALVDLLAADFMGPKLQGSIKLQLKCYVGVVLGAIGMSIMALWA